MFKSYSAILLHKNTIFLALIYRNNFCSNLKELKILSTKWMSCAS